MRQTKCNWAVRGRGSVQCKGEEGRWGRADVSIGEVNNLSCKEHRLDKNLLHTNRHFNSIRSLRQPLAVCVRVCVCALMCACVLHFTMTHNKVCLPLCVCQFAHFVFAQRARANKLSQRAQPEREGERGRASEIAIPEQARQRCSGERRLAPFVKFTCRCCTFYSVVTDRVRWREQVARYSAHATHLLLLLHSFSLVLLS